MILAGDEYLCVQEYFRILKNSPPLCKPELIISRSSKDSVPDGNVVFVMSEYTNKRADKTFDYIGPNELTRLKKELGKYKDYHEYVPFSEFKDLKNPQYSVIGYNLLGFFNSIVPLIDANKLSLPSAARKEYLNVFDVADLFIGEHWDDFVKHYDMGSEENLLWVIDNTVQTCIQIKINQVQGIHPYRINKLKPVCSKITINKLLAFKELIYKLITSKRDAEHNNKYSLLFRPLAEFNNKIYNEQS